MSISVAGMLEAFVQMVVALGTVFASRIENTAVPESSLDMAHEQVLSTQLTPTGSLCCTIQCAGQLLVTE